MFKQILERVPKARTYGGIAFLVILIAVEVYATCLIPEWRKLFYGVLERKASGELAGALQFFLGVICMLIVSQGLKLYVGRTTALGIRTGITKLLLKSWVKGGLNQKVDNPAQRINEDCHLATDFFVRIGIELIISTAIVIITMWGARHNSAILIAASAYTVVICAVALIFKKPLISKEISLQRAEADHRHALSKMAIGAGDFTAKGHYENIKASTIKYLRVLLGYNIFSSTQNSLSILVPFAILSVPYFKGEINLGEFMGGVSMFELIVVNSTVLVTLFPEATKAQASWIRIKEFYKSVKEER